MKTLLLFDPEREKEIKEKMMPMLSGIVTDTAAYELSWPSGLSSQDRIITCLGDEPLSSLIKLAAAKKVTVGFLPHPDMVHVRQYFGIASKPEDAVDDLKNNDIVKADLLLCNKQPVFNSVIIGDAFTLTEVKNENSWFAKFKRTFSLMRNLRSLRLNPFTLVTKNGKKFDTAALGIVLVTQGKNSLFSPGALSDSLAGLIQAVILSPRSIGELMLYLLTSLFRKVNVDERLPPFVSHIQSKTLNISASQEFDYTIDGKLSSAREMKIGVESGALSVIPGSRMEKIEQAAEDKESFKIRALPLGETKNELVSRTLPVLTRASTDDFRDLFITLRENSSLSESFVILMLLSGLLATVGLFANSGSVIIGAMILAPLMSPIITLAMGLLRQDDKLVVQSLKTVFIGMVIALASGAFMTKILPFNTITYEISIRMSPTLLDLFVAIVSGAAGAYCYAKDKLTSSLAAVAIAVALVPPLAVAGIGIGWGSLTVLSGASLLFITNMAGILLAGGITFVFLGYSPFHRAKKGLIISLLLAILVSIPLVFGFIRVIEKQHVINALDGWETHGVVIQDVVILPGQPLSLSVKLLAKDPLTVEAVDNVKASIEEKLQQPVLLEASLAVFR